MFTFKKMTLFCSYNAEDLTKNCQENSGDDDFLINQKMLTFLDFSLLKTKKGVSMNLRKVSGNELS